MKDVNGEITYKGKTFKLVFNLNVMEQIQDEYGSVDKWGELTDGRAGEPSAKAVIFGMACMINESIDIDNEDLPEDQKTQPLTLKQVGRLITEVGLLNATKTMNETVIGSTESAEKN